MVLDHTTHWTTLVHGPTLAALLGDGTAYQISRIYRNANTKPCSCETCVEYRRQLAEVNRTEPNRTKEPSSARPRHRRPRR